MELYDKILSKEYINDRFVEAVYITLNKKLVSDKTTLAEALKCKPSKFSEILNGRMRAGIDMAAYICEYFDISPDWLLLSRGGYFRTSPAPSIYISEGAGSPEYSKYIQEYEDYQKGLIHKDKNKSDAKVETLMSLIKDKDLTIREQATEIGRLQERIAQLERENTRLASDAHTSAIANAG